MLTPSSNDVININQKQWYNNYSTDTSLIIHIEPLHGFVLFDTKFGSMDVFNPHLTNNHMIRLVYMLTLTVNG